MKRMFFISIVIVLLITSACIESTATVAPPARTRDESIPTVAAPREITVEPTKTPDEPPVANLDREIDAVWHNQKITGEAQVMNSAPVYVGDQVWTKDKGQGLLKFPDMWLRIFYASQMKVDPCVTSLFCLPILSGTMLGSGKGHYEFTTNNSRIIVTGTTFIISFLPDRQVTLVRIFDGQVEFSNTLGNPQTAPVSAGQWGMVVNDQAPVVSNNPEDLRQTADGLGLWDLYLQIEQQVSGQFGPNPVAPNQVIPAFYSKEGLEFNVQRPGQFYSEIEVQNPQLCREACQKDSPRCASFNFIKDQNRCVLKEGTPDAEANNCCVSGVGTIEKNPPVISDFRSKPAEGMACLENLGSIRVESTITDPSGVRTGSVLYRYGDRDWAPIEMSRADTQFSASLTDLQQGLLSFKVQAADALGNVGETPPQNINVFRCAGLESGSTRSGKPFATITSENPQDCRLACDSNPECDSMNYVVSQKQCQFLRGVPLPQNDSCCYSAVLNVDRDSPVVSITGSSPAGPWVCIQNATQLTVSSSINDRSGIQTATLNYLFNPTGGSGGWIHQPMQESNGNYSGVINIPGSGELKWFIQASDPYDHIKKTETQLINYWNCDGLLFNTNLPDPKGVDLDFNSPSTLSSNDPEICRQLCQNTPRCYAFTYVPSQKACWIKSGEPLPVGDSACVSGIIREDKQPPVISQVYSDPPKAMDYLCGARNTRVSAYVTDPSSITSVELMMRRRIGKTTTDWQTIPMSLSQGTLEGGTFIVDIPVDTLQIIDFVIVAVDIHGNRSKTEYFHLTYTLC